MKILLFILIVLIYFIDSRSSFTNTKDKILIITAEDRNEPFIKYHDNNFNKYANMHGYTYLRLSNCPKEESSTYWCKIHLLKKYLDTDYDYIMWCDSDTIITDYNKRLETYIHSFRKNIIIGQDCKIIDSFIDINAGVFIIKNNEVGKSFINDCLKTLKDRPDCIVNNKEQGQWAGICYEQGIMNELYRSDKYNSEIYVDKERVFVYNDCFKSYIDDLKIVKEYPFIVHLCGISNENRSNLFKTFI
jgi:hypothetical protein